MEWDEVHFTPLVSVATLLNDHPDSHDCRFLRQKKNSTPDADVWLEITRTSPGVRMQKRASRMRKRNQRAETTCTRKLCESYQTSKRKHVM